MAWPSTPLWETSPFCRSALSARPSSSSAMCPTRSRRAVSSRLTSRHCPRCPTLPTCLTWLAVTRQPTSATRPTPSTSRTTRWRCAALLRVAVHAVHISHSSASLSVVAGLLPLAACGGQIKPVAADAQRVCAHSRPEGGRTSSRTQIRKTKNPTKVSVEQRLHEFPGETLCKSAGILFCRCCKQTLPTIKSSIIVHRDSTKHKEKKIEYAVPAPAPRATFPENRATLPARPRLTPHASSLTLPYPR